MGPKLLCVIIMMGLSTVLYSQNSAIRIRYERNEDHSVDFFYEKDVVGTHYVQVTFDRLENAVSNGYRGIIKGEEGRLFRLRPTMDDRGIGFSYRYNYVLGTPNLKIDTNFVYQLPYREGLRCQVFDMTSVYGDYFNFKTGDNWRALLFALAPGDTVYAIRKGLVIDVIDGFSPDTTADFSYNPNVNQIRIEHPDGTIARFEGLRKDNFLVSPGETVYPNQPIGIVARYDQDIDGELRLVIFHLSERAIENMNQGDKSSRTDWYDYIDPLFYTKGGNFRLKDRGFYEGATTVELITAEMTKRERKKAGFK